MTDPLNVVSASDIAKVSGVLLPKVKRWLKTTRRPAVVRHGEELLYLASAAQALLDETAPPNRRARK